jgi:hypothetical protein
MACYGRRVAGGPTHWVAFPGPSQSWLMLDKWDWCAVKIVQEASYVPNELN